MKHFNHLAVSALALSAAILSGCAGATRLPLRAKGFAGEPLENNQLDLAFLDAPGTQREEVVSRLSSIDTSYSNPHLFWGRWSESKWGYWWVIAGGYSAAGDAKRIWHIHNLLVSFDENGTVRRKELFKDDKSLWTELHIRLADAPLLDLSQPIPIEVIGSGKVRAMTLGKDSIQFDRRNALLPVQISPQAIARISRSRLGIIGNPLVTCHTVYLAEKSPMGRKFRFAPSLPTSPQHFNISSNMDRRSSAGIELSNPL